MVPHTLARSRLICHLDTPNKLSHNAGVKEKKLSAPSKLILNNQLEARWVGQLLQGRGLCTDYQVELYHLFCGELLQ